MAMAQGTEPRQRKGGDKAPDGPGAQGGGNAVGPARSAAAADTYVRPCVTWAIIFG